MLRRKGALRVAVVERYDFHEETLLSFVSTVSSFSQIEHVDIYAPDHRGSRHFLHDILELNCAWSSYEDFIRLGRAGKEGRRYDLVIVNTVLAPWTDETLSIASRLGSTVLGLVHDMQYFKDPKAFSAALDQHQNLHFSYPGIAAPDGLPYLDARSRARTVQFVPIFRIEDSDGTQQGEPTVVLPGTIEFSRRDYEAVLKFVADADLRLTIVGRSRDSAHGRQIELTLASDLQRLERLVADHRLGAGQVLISTDVPCFEYFQTIIRADFTCIAPVNDEYFQGKLTGALTATLSCGVPILSPRKVCTYLAQEEPLLATCVRELDPDQKWNSAELADLRRQTKKVRDVLMEKNAETLLKIIHR